MFCKSTDWTGMFLHEELIRALNDVIESGKVRYIGASSVS